MSAPRSRRCPAAEPAQHGSYGVRSALAEVPRSGACFQRDSHRPLRARGGAPARHSLNATPLWSAPRSRRCPELGDGRDHRRGVRSALAEVPRLAQHPGAAGRSPLRARGGAPETGTHDRRDRESAPRSRRCPADQVPVRIRLGVRSALAEVPRQICMNVAEWAGPLRARGGAPVRQRTTGLRSQSAPRSRRCPAEPAAAPAHVSVRSALAEVPRSRVGARRCGLGPLRARGGAPSRARMTRTLAESAPRSRRCPGVRPGSEE